MSCVGLSLLHAGRDVQYWYQLLPLSQELLQSLSFEGLEWDISGEKNELVVYRKDHSMKMLLQSRKVRDCQPVVFILASMTFMMGGSMFSCDIRGCERAVISGTVFTHLLRKLLWCDWEVGTIMS